MGWAKWSHVEICRTSYEWIKILSYLWRITMWYFDPYHSKWIEIILEICLFLVLCEIEIVEFISQLDLVWLFSSCHMDLFSICRCRIKRNISFQLFDVRDIQDTISCFQPWDCSSKFMVKPYEFILIFLVCLTTWLLTCEAYKTFLIHIT